MTKLVAVLINYGHIIDVHYTFEDGSTNEKRYTTMSKPISILLSNGYKYERNMVVNNEKHGTQNIAEIWIKEIPDKEESIQDDI